MHRPQFSFSVCRSRCNAQFSRRRKTGRSGAGRWGRAWQPAGDYPVKFSSTEGVAWKAKLPGVGTSTPAVWGDRIFVTCGIKGDGGEVHDGVVCFDMNGKELWRQQFGAEAAGQESACAAAAIRRRRPMARTSLCITRRGTLACLDLAGKEKWKINLQEKFGKDTLWWDLGTSPVLADGRADRGCDAGWRLVSGRGRFEERQSRWKEQRQYETPRETDHSYCTPQVVQVRWQGRDRDLGGRSSDGPRCGHR